MATRTKRMLFKGWYLSGYNYGSRYLVAAERRTRSISSFIGFDNKVNFCYTFYPITEEHEEIKMAMLELLFSLED